MRNLPWPPARPQWTKAERAEKLRRRERRIEWGKLVSVIGSVLLIGVDGRVQTTRSEIENAANFARMQAQIISLQADVNRQWSYWGAPPPRNPGQ